MKNIKKTGIFEIVPPAIDSELNAEGRAKRGNYKPDLKPKEFVEAVMRNFENDVFEFGYGMTLGHLKASREELDKSFQQMNSRW